MAPGTEVCDTDSKPDQGAQGSTSASNETIATELTCFSHVLLQETVLADQPDAKRRRGSKHTVTPLAQLPGELLVCVLRHVEQQQRLRVCSLVSHAWRDAAAAATASLVATLRGPRYMLCLNYWLANNSVQPCAVSLSGLYTMARQRICLRCGQLRKLQQLQLDFAAEAALQLQQRAGVCNAQQADLPQVRGLSTTLQRSTDAHYPKLHQLT